MLNFHRDPLLPYYSAVLSGKIVLIEQSEYTIWSRLQENSPRLMISSLIIYHNYNNFSMWYLEIPLE